MIKNTNLYVSKVTLTLLYTFFPISSSLQVPSPLLVLSVPLLRYDPLVSPISVTHFYVRNPTDVLISRDLTN